MEKKIYVFGHINPDTDSICSAIAYTYLKRSLGIENVEAARLGKINKETQFALNYFQAEPPILINNIKPQVSDMNYYAVPPIYTTDSVKKAWDIMTSQHRQMIPILYPDHKLAGIISVSDIAKAYIGLTNASVLRQHQTPFENITAVLEGKLLSGNYPYASVSGDVHSTASIAEDEKLNDADIIITGANTSHIQSALSSGAGCVIITDNAANKYPYSEFNASSCAVIATPHSFFKTIKMISQSIPVKGILIRKNIIFFETDDSLDEVKEAMLDSPHRYFPILDEEGQVRGIISKRHLIDIQKKQVILVDHNEKNQSISGIEQAEILEIIDHHRIANIDTGTPVFLRAEPVGCTSTIIAKMYEMHHIVPPKSIAGLMLSAILSDTLIFKSPTCTADDKMVAKKLAKIAEVDLDEYGSELINAGTSLEGVSADDLLYIDRKHFTIGKYNVSVSQINTGDFKSLFNLKDDLLAKMKELETREALDLCYRYCDRRHRTFGYWQRSSSCRACL